MISVRGERGEKMSTWRWKYDPEKCDHGICVGDCDVCDREEDENEEKCEKNEEK